MTGIEMDIDMAKPGGLGGHIDDDIIDFDTDMLDQHDQEPQNHHVNTESMDRDMQEGVDTANHEAYQTNGYMSEDVDFDLHDVEETTHDSEQDVGKTTVPQTENQAAMSAGRAQEVVGHIEISNETDRQNQEVQDDHASAHEIDYEVEDQIEEQESQKEMHQESQNESRKELHEGVNADNLEASGTDAATGDVVDDAHHLEDVIEGQEQEAQTESTDQARGQESTQNEDEKHEQETAPDNHEAATLGSAEAVAADNLEEADYEDGDQYDDEHSADHEEGATRETEADHDDARHVEDVEHITYDQAEVDVDEHPEGETADLEHDDHSTNGDNAATKPETEFPVITVQYKGDEFPLFSATSDGFFTDTSILDETLEKLLAGLRSELENEIAEEDELVFQVDELGLELAESTQGELMTNVTFRQIVEIFDLLVKNQDPDGSKTLYTYLFTKPNTEKRLESLIESATAGKGLDEVIHLFESPMPAASTLMEADNAVDGLHEELDGFDSPEDEGQPDETQSAQHAGENSREAGLDTDVEVPTTHDDAEDEHDDDDVTTQPTTEPPANAGTLDETVTETSHHPDVVAEDENSERNGKATSPSASSFDCYYPGFCLCAPCVAEFVENHEREEAEYRQSLGLQQTAKHSLTRFERSFLDHGRKKHTHSQSDFSMTFSYQDTDEFFPAPVDSETDPFADLELDVGAEDDDEVDLGDETVAEEQVAVELETAHARTSDTSTTATLKDEDEAGSVNVDLGADATEEGAVKKTGLDEENDLDEIDWRDEPEVDEEGPSTPSAAGKRARGDDDEVDAEDEQDVKRRRP
ncbi:hypothetical protein N0V84_010317 [Fusarium piperis]|uniref:Uncharacterized protein n=1 Tax=Fusarium piperis TaxID=1435070 RepID=A0A9W8W1R3_9HYPO|nr:hypothetical protein N0V84_010317 [Fusarium piperis]